MGLIAKCGDQQLKARIVNEKGDKSEGILNDLNAWRESLFKE